MDAQPEDAESSEESEITVTDSSPLQLANAEMAAMFKQLKLLTNDHAMMRRRLHTLAIFADRKFPSGQVYKDKAQTAYNASPEEELFFEHRLHYEQLNASLTAAHTAMASLTDAGKSSSEYAKEVLACLRAIQDLEGRAEKRLEAMSDILEGLRKQLADKEAKMITLTHDRSQLVQAAMFHKDKMEIARDTIVASGDIKQRLATKYNLSVEEVEAMVNARPALLEEMDADKKAG